MDQAATLQFGRGICELLHEELAQVAGGMIDDGHTPVTTRVPGRLTPDADESHHVAGAGLFVQQGF
jgi:hypothetical protein